MNIYGEKIVLRAIEPADCALLLEMINDQETEKMLGGSSFPVSAAAQAKWIADQTGRNDILRCIVADRDNPEKGVGTVILSDIDYKNGVAQVHIKLGADCRGKGYGTDALNAVVDYAFRQMRLHCVYAHVLEYNEVSQKLFQKCGFRREGRLRARAYKNGAYVDAISYSIVNDDA